MEQPLKLVRAPFDQGTPSKLDIKERFYRYFQEEVIELQEQMGQLENHSLVGGERQDAISHCLAGISRLSNEVTDASKYLPAYDQRTYGQAVKALTEKLQETRSKFAPKSRFQFKFTGKNNSAISLADAAEIVAAQQRSEPKRNAQGFLSSTDSSIGGTPANLMTPPGEPRDTVGELPSFAKNYNEEMINKPGGAIRKPSFSEAANVNITGHTGLHIILPSSASRATSSGSITKLNRCIVDMSAPTSNGTPFAGLALKNISESLIIAGHVAGAAHITGVKNSIIVVSSRQVRMHDCKDVDIYLLCASRPIIEDCHNVRFSPIPACHTIASNDSVENHWDQVDDFKWLKSEHSPNWSILPETERLGDEIWTGVVPGVPGVGLEDILKKIGIAKRSL